MWLRILKKSRRQLEKSDWKSTTLGAQNRLFWPKINIFSSYFALFVLICPPPPPPQKKKNAREDFSFHSTSSVHERGAGRFDCLVHPDVRDQRRVSEIDLPQPRHETAFWWRHNGPVTSQLTDPLKWPNYPLELIGIYAHINTYNKESLTQICRRSTNVQMCWIFCIYQYDLSLNGWHALFRIKNNRHDVNITAHAIKRRFLIWMRTMRQLMKRRCSWILTPKIHLYLCLLVNETKNPQHLDCGRSMHATYRGFNNSRLIASIDPTHQGGVDS